MRIVSSEVVGKSLSIVGIGQPIALSLGVPLATGLGNVIGWNTIFLLVSILSILLFITIIFVVPNVSVESKTQSIPFKKVLTNTGVQRIVLVTLFWILAHSLLYTYISPFLDASNLASHLDVILFLFGISSIIGIWVTGRFIDRFLNRFLAINLLVFGLAGVLLLLGQVHPAFVFMGVMFWGYSFGGAPIMMQKDLADVAKDYIDIAQSVSVTAFNTAIAGGGFIGGLILTHFEVRYIVVLFILLTILTIFVCFGKWSRK